MAKTPKTPQNAASNTGEEARTGKTIVVLLDGTSNQITKRRTHVLRLYGALAKSDAQLVYYDPGVGTFGGDEDGFLNARRRREIFQLATGKGLMANVREAYEFLMDKYNEGDRIALVGFSRGAFTARVLAGVLHAVGLIEPRNRNLLDYVFDAYKKIEGGQLDTGSSDKDNPFAEINLVNRVLKARRVTIDALLLFDTVASMLAWGKYGFPRLRSFAYADRNPSVRAVRHAVAVDEKRWLFRPSLWETGPCWGGSLMPVPQPETQDVEEVWFSGSHRDVGGGVEEAKSALGKVPLRWMITEAAKLGVAFIPETVELIVDGTVDPKYAKPDPLADINDSMTRPWRVIEHVPLSRVSGGWGAHRAGMLGRFGLYAPRQEPRLIPEGAQIHPSVYERRAGRSDYDPENVPDA
ncbi:DUF2235 domain-containing protein [Roseobacteraceae bacterium S113]